MSDLETLAKSVVLTSLATKIADNKNINPAEKAAQERKIRQMSTPRVRREIEKFSKELSRLTPAQLAKKLTAVVGESADDLLVEEFDSEEDRNNWIKKNGWKFSTIWILDTLNESESSKESARLILEHYIEDGIDLNTAVSMILEDRSIMKKHIRAALKEMHKEKIIYISELSVKI